MIYSEKPENFNPRFEVVSCFCECDGNILLLHRDNDSPQGDKWGAPAGKREINEDLFIAMNREIKEETGVSITSSELKFHDTLFVRYEDYDFLYHTFSAKFSKQPEIVIDKREHKKFIWITPKDALKLPLVKDMDTCIKLFYQI